MRRFLGGVVLMAGLVACARPPEAGKSHAESPAEQAAPPAVQSAPPAEQSAPEGSEGGSKSGRIGKKCEYEDVPGTASVIAISDEPANGDCSNQPKKVTLKFAPNDATAKPNPRDDAFVLVVGGVGFVAAGCLAAYKVAVGTKLKTVRHTKTAGACSPVVYEVAALSSPDDITKCVAFCSK